MGLELLKRLDTSAVDLSFKRYHNQTTTAIFKGGSTVDKTGKDGGAATEATLEYEIETAIEDMDGGKLNPGSTLKQRVWIPQRMVASKTAWRLKDLAFVALALRSSPPQGRRAGPHA